MPIFRCSFSSVVLIAFAVLRIGSRADSSKSTLTEVDLHETLFKRYNPKIMPRTEGSLPIVVGVEMELLSVENINEKQQTISVRALLEMTWKDTFLQWDPQKYSNVTIINVHVDNIWMPDLALENTFDKPTDLGQDGGNAIVDSLGNVKVWPYKTYTVACKIHIANFPFDEQTCTYQFTSWTNPSSVLALENLSGILRRSSYSESGEWALTETTVTKETLEYDLFEFDILRFQLKLKRKSLFHVMNLIVPVLCISLLSILCFVLPSAEGERVTLSISIFLTLAVFLTIVNSSMPESSDEVAKFGVFVGLQLLGSALTIIFTTISLYMFHRTEDKPVAGLFRFLVKISLIYVPNVSYSTVTVESNASENGSTTLNKSAVQRGTCKVADELGFSSKQHNVNKVDWKTVSKALDRVCLLSAFIWHGIFIAIFFGSTVR